MATSNILITGAGKGIGRSLAHAFCRHKSVEFTPRLFLASRTLTDLQSLQSECYALNTDAEILVADISNLADVARLYDAAVKAFGHIDGLINNAGVGRFKDILELTPEDFDFTMQTNLKGTFFLTQKVLAEMIARQSGHIMFITSVAAETAFEQSAVYCMSKFAQKGLVEVLRLYGRKHGIRITNVMPGAVYTPMWGEQNAAMQSKMMRPEDIAEAMVNAYLQPARTSIEEIVLRPTGGDL